VQHSIQQNYTWFLNGLKDDLVNCKQHLVLIIGKTRLLGTIPHIGLQNNLIIVDHLQNHVPL
jgi:hypothetical protein